MVGPEEVDSIARERPALQEARVSPDVRAATMADTHYWRSICPWLHVGDPAMRRLAGTSLITPTADLVDECRDRMQEDGYWEVAQGRLDEDTGTQALAWAVDIADVARGVSTLVGRGWPPNFIMVYD